MDYALFATEPVIAVHQRPTHHVYITERDDPEARPYAYDFGQFKIDRADFKQWVRETWGSVHQVYVVGRWPNYSVRRYKDCC